MVTGYEKKARFHIFYIQNNIDRQHNRLPRMFTRITSPGGALPATR